MSSLCKNRKRDAAVSGVAIGEDEVRLAITKQRQYVHRYEVDVAGQPAVLIAKQSVEALQQFDKLTAGKSQNRRASCPA